MCVTAGIQSVRNTEGEPVVDSDAELAAAPGCDTYACLSLFDVHARQKNTIYC